MQVDITYSKILWKEEEYQLPTKELSIYKTRTPIIISVNNVEHKMAYSFANNGKLDELLKKRIVDITKMQCKQFFNLIWSLMISRISYEYKQDYS